MRRVSYFFIFIIFLFAVNNNYADRRYFGRSYLAYTLPSGAFEFELWNTGNIGRQSGFFYQFQPRFEFEYGITDRLSASLYFNFNQVTAEDNNISSKPLEFSSTSLELRYRLTNPGEIFVDPALYFEFAYGGESVEYESKVIFSKRFGDFLTAVNFNSEIEREITQSESESEFEITGGIAYDVSSGLAFGLELKHNRGYEGIYEKEEANATYLGPTVNLQTKSFYLTFNFLAQVTGSPSSKDGLDLIHHNRYEFRTILGIEL